MYLTLEKRYKSIFPINFSNFFQTFKEVREIQSSSSVKIKNVQISMSSWRNTSQNGANNELAKKTSSSVSRRSKPSVRSLVLRKNARWPNARRKRRSVVFEKSKRRNSAILRRRGNVSKKLNVSVKLWSKPWRTRTRRDQTSPSPRRTPAWYVEFLQILAVFSSFHLLTAWFVISCYGT